MPLILLSFVYTYFLLCQICFQHFYHRSSNIPLYRYIIQVIYFFDVLTIKNGYAIILLAQKEGMLMYQVAICDDEPHAAEQNETMLCHILEARNLRRDVDYSIHCFSSSASLLAQMERHPSAFHLLLLDIELENENGLSLAAHLRENGSDCSIIYITAYRDYVFDCFDTRPLHYLLKPVDPEKLAGVIDRDLRDNYHPEQIDFLVDGCWRAVNARDILYAEATSHKSAIYLRGGEVLYINQNFSDLLPRLNGQKFCRSHFSILVNLEHIYRLNGSTLILDNGRELPVSRSRQKELKKQYIAFIK